MIRSFRSKETEDIWHGTRTRRFSVEVQVRVRRKLRMLNNAQTLDDLRVPPGNRLEALKGDRKGYWSIRVNDQLRICFTWSEGDSFEVELMDYH
jgi:proteic killer suppression protein